MNVTAKLALASTLLAAAVLALGYGLGSAWSGVGPILAVGLLWLASQWRDWWGWTASWALAFFTGAAAVGLWLGLGAGWMLAGVVAALSAWDLDHFAQRLKRAGWVEGTCALEHRHLRRLLAVDGLGFLLGAVALGIRIPFGFGVALVLGLLAMWGLSRAVGFLRREGD
jgi:hypothetical protein